MSDALSDIAQDEDIRKEFGRMIELEQAGLKLGAKGFRKRAKRIIEGWAGYSLMKRGFWTSPLESSAKKRILAIGRFLDGKIKYGDLKKELLAEKPENSFYNYFAVGGHGRLMNNAEEAIELALWRKFGERVDSFRAVVDDRGRIDFERVSCGSCPRAGHCFMTDNCNCYDGGAYAAVVVKEKKDREELEGILRRYKVNLGI